MMRGFIITLLKRAPVTINHYSTSVLKQQETKLESHDDLAKFNAENCFANQLG
jgi:hypothetical protein